MKDVYVAGRKYRLDPALLLGEGGEAEIFDLSAQLLGKVLKLWKSPDYPDFQGATDEARRNREAAALRLSESEAKLKAFPKGLPQVVIAPEETALARDSSVVGFTMRKISGAEVLRRYTQRSFLTTAGVSRAQLLELFRQLHNTVRGVHQAKVVIGDFNYLNILVKAAEINLIDADSFQFGRFLTRSFTTRFVDPLICAAHEVTPVQAAPHSALTDWYAFAIMLFECLTFVHPYGGIYQPRKGEANVALDSRSLKRITVFNPQVLYPVKGVPFGYLPDELLEFYHRLLEKDARGEFPIKLLENLHWTVCDHCKTEHARPICPVCAAPVAQRIVTQKVRGAARLTRILQGGVIVHADWQDGALRAVMHDGSAYRREDKTQIFESPLDRSTRVRVLGAKTAVAIDGQLALIAPGQEAQMFNVDQFRGLRPVFDTNEDHLYWVDQGRLLHDGALEPKFIGEVLKNQTKIWVGTRFGFGFSRAGGYQNAFVFDAERTGIKEVEGFPALKGELLDVQCFFSKSRVWVLAAVNRSGTIHHLCCVIDAIGQVKALASGQEDDGTWLGTLGAKCAADIGGAQPVHALFAFTDQGLVRIEETSSGVQLSKEFPDTRGLSSSDCRLLASPGGLICVSRDRADLLSLKP